MPRSVPLGVLLSGLASPALAAAPAASLPGGWFGDSISGLVLLVIAAAYIDGLVQSLMRRDDGMPSPPRIAAFAAGMGLAGLVMLSPLDALGDHWFSAHMAQHLLLIVVIAPLFAWSDPHPILVKALPASVTVRLAAALDAGSIARWRNGPEAAWLAAAAFAIAIWLWHLPAAHDWAAAGGVPHALEHFTMLGTASLFWYVILTSGRRRISPGLAAVVVSIVSLQGALLSAIIMFAPNQLCSSYAGNPLDDQVLAGLLMCIPASFVYFGSTIWALSRMLGDGQQHAR